MAGGVNWFYMPWNCTLDTCPWRQVIHPHPTAPAVCEALPKAGLGGSTELHPRPQRVLELNLLFLKCI